MHWTWYTGTCSITTMGLLYKFDDMVKCMCYMGLGFNNYFMAGVALTGGHYKMDIISGVGQLRLDSVMPQVLCMVTYNIWGIGVILQVTRHSANLVGKG
jgi:hypothetical protein